MSTETAQRSATIYQFPARWPEGDQRRAIQTVRRSVPSRVATVSGGAWYHDAAIQESKLAGER